MNDVTICGQVAAESAGRQAPPSWFDLQAKPLWPTLCFQRHWEVHEQERAALTEHLFDLRSGRESRIASGIALGSKSRRGLFESGFDVLADRHASIQRLREFIVDSIRQVVVRLNDPRVPPTRVNVEIVDSWFHITNNGGFHDAHFHGGCSWCGIYYLQVGEAAAPATGGAPNGGSRFYSPIARGGGFNDFGNQYLNAATSVDAPIRDGLLLLFPSYLLHAGLPYAGVQDRIVIAFNSRSHLQSK